MHRPPIPIGNPAVRVLIKMRLSRLASPERAQDRRWHRLQCTPFTFLKPARYSRSKKVCTESNPALSATGAIEHGPTAGEPAQLLHRSAGQYQDVVDRRMSVRHSLRVQFPQAQARYGDGIQALRTNLRRRRDFIAVDPFGLYGPSSSYCERFEVSLLHSTRHRISGLLCS